MCYWGELMFEASPRGGEWIRRVLLGGAGKRPGRDEGTNVEEFSLNS